MDGASIERCMFVGHAAPVGPDVVVVRCAPFFQEGNELGAEH